MLYDIGDTTYLALTSRCPVSCRFCVKTAWGMRFQGHDLRVAREPDASALLEALKERLDLGGVREVVFCGFGECSYRLDAVSLIGLHLRLHRPGVRVRLNTIGLGNAIWGRDITPLLALCLDAVSVSLNTADPLQWDELHRPRPQYRGGFGEVVSFTERCLAAGLETRLTAVELPEVDLGAVRVLAGALGAGFLARPLLSAEG